MSNQEEKTSRQLTKDWHLPKHESFKKGLRINAQKWFKENDNPTHSKMAYCLDKHDNWSKNIILYEVADYIKKIRIEKEEQKKFFPLHKYVHHGLSSQALVFNLLGPLIIRNDYSIVRTI